MGAIADCIWEMCEEVTLEDVSFPLSAQGHNKVRNKGRDIRCDARRSPSRWCWHRHRPADASCRRPRHPSCSVPRQTSQRSTLCCYLWGKEKLAGGVTASRRQLGHESPAACTSGPRWRFRQRGTAAMRGTTSRLGRRSEYGKERSRQRNKRTA